MVKGSKTMTSSKYIHDLICLTRQMATFYEECMYKLVPYHAITTLCKLL